MAREEKGTCLQVPFFVIFKLYSCITVFDVMLAVAV